MYIYVCMYIYTPYTLLASCTCGFLIVLVVVAVVIVLYDE